MAALSFSEGADPSSSQMHHPEHDHIPRSPLFQVNGDPLPTDSMVTVRLSDSLRAIDQSADEHLAQPVLTLDTTLRVRPDSRRITIIEDIDGSPVVTPGTDFEEAEDDRCLMTPLPDSPISNHALQAADENHNAAFNQLNASSASRSRSNSAGTDFSVGSSESVDWHELGRNEENEPKDESSDESTAFLLARLEQENNAIATDPKSVSSKAPINAQLQSVKRSRPPSMQHLKRLVNGPVPDSLRYSQILTPPPMTELEFYAALVSDYNRTAQCLPTLLSKKIRGGIPPPLRGMVWQSMAGSRSKLLEDQYERLAEESSPYEGMIGKDIGRSFPGVDMFKDPEGEGQRMLGRVLKSFSLYDSKIGYCQGLGFLVGPLLMHMGEKEAFCVLVRLMEHYKLRSCFLPDLSGLHLRIFQIQKLFSQHLPVLATHLAKLQIEAAYISQWFLSFFAVTCPLPMLFRIYDVIFAEGASETMMRVALSLMRRNEKRLLGCTEFEDVMQLLLSRSVWDTYACNADDLVNDFVSFTGMVTRESLQTLETSFQESQASDSSSKTAAFPDLQAAASRFLGRIWAGSNSSTKSTNLSPSRSVPSRPTSMLKRSPSKQSLTSTLNSAEGGSESGGSNALTEATTMSREFSADSESLVSNTPATPAQSATKRTVANKDRDLHSQIEDLLTALNEMQRQQAVVESELQRERESREDDRKVVRALLSKLQATSINLRPLSTSDETPSSILAEKASEDCSDDETVIPEPVVPSESLEQLISAADHRFSPTSSRISAIHETKHQLREDLARTREQFAAETIRAQGLDRRIADQNILIESLRDEIKDTRDRMQDSVGYNQRLETRIRDLRARPQEARATMNDAPNSASSNSSSSASNSDSTSARSSITSPGLRELRLGRPQSIARSPTTAGFSKRTSSLATKSILSTENHAPAAEEALLVELVNAKTAEAVAKQEAEEAKAKLESLRKLISKDATDSATQLSNGGGAPSGHRSSPSQPNIERTATMSAFTTLMSSSATPRGHAPSSSLTPVPEPKVQKHKTQTSTGGGFWSGWGKRSVSPAPPSAAT